MEGRSVSVMIRCGEDTDVHLKEKKCAISIVLYLIIGLQFLRVQGILRNPRGLSICSLEMKFQEAPTLAG